MTPLPKRKHSKSRKNKRIATRRKDLVIPVKCHSCGQKKVSHLACPNCQN